MKNTFRALFFVSSIFIIACQNDNGVQEIKNGPNADLVRNPASASEPLDTNQLARITYEEPEFNFGNAKEGDLITHKFKFHNTGKIPLVIQKARSTCGCTIPEWPEDPIPPGGTGEITAKFNTDGKAGDQRKQIRVTANTYPSETKVVLTGTVYPTKSE